MEHSPLPILEIESSMPETTSPCCAMLQICKKQKRIKQVPPPHPAPIPVGISSSNFWMWDLIIEQETFSLYKFSCNRNHSSHSLGFYLCHTNFDIQYCFLFLCCFKNRLNRTCLDHNMFIVWLKIWLKCHFYNAVIVGGLWWWW